MDTNPSATNDPQYHVSNIRGMLNEVANHAREDVSKVDDPRARALFETTAETLEGLMRAFDDYKQGIEEAWRR